MCIRDSSQPSDPRPVDMHGCIFFYNSSSHSVQIELPRDVSGIWPFQKKDEDGDRGWLTKNGWEVQVDRTSILRITDYQNRTAQISLQDALGKGAFYEEEKKCSHGGWAWIVKY